MLREATRLRLAPGQAPDPISCAPQRRRDGEPDVSRGSRDEDWHSSRTVADAPGFPRVRTIVHARDPLEALLNPSRLPLALFETLLGAREQRLPLGRGGALRPEALRRLPERPEPLMPFPQRACLVRAAPEEQQREQHDEHDDRDRDRRCHATATWSWRAKSTPGR